MKEKSKDILKGIFSLFTILSILGGGIVFIMLIVALVLGGNIGETIAINAKDVIMPYFIRFASIGVLGGLIFSYLVNEHGLSL